MSALYLKPGEICFAAAHEEVATLLGSCVALTLWHPPTRLGGMCHYVLPHQPRGVPGGTRYGEAAFAWFMDALARRGIPARECQARIFGGGVMFSGAAAGPLDVGAQNIRLARERAAAHGLTLVEEGVGGPLYRHITLTLADGAVRVREGLAGMGSAA